MAATHVEAVTRLAGPGPKRILGLGAGSGFASAALASAGHDVVAIGLVTACVESITRLAVDIDGGSLRAIAADFYSVELEGPFDIVRYFDGFGIGSDDDQRRLLRRIDAWLSPGGCALVDVFAPWYWAKMSGSREEFPAGSGVLYEAGFDAEGAGWLSVCGEKGTKTLPSPSPSDAIHRRISASCSRRSACLSW